MDTAGHTAIADVQALEPDFEVLRELGRGTMGVVVLARRRETGRLVAIKVVHPMSGDSRDAEARVEREARTVARLQHPNIVRHYEMRRLPNGGIALVMQYVAGETLAATLRRTPRLPPDIASQVLHDIALALKYAHEQQIIHRDVKPANIFIYPDTGAALLSDFGIAKSLEGDADITLAGFAIGTPTYMSPEQLDGHALDRRTDIYSLGVVGWEMLSGVRPWLGENLYGVIYKQKHQALPRLASIRDDVPARIVHALDGALEKDPALRFASMTEFLEQLADDAPTNATWRRHAARGTDPTTAVTRPEAEPTVTIQFRPAVESAPAPAPETALAPTPSAPVPPAASTPVVQLHPPVAADLAAADLAAADFTATEGDAIDVAATEAAAADAVGTEAEATDAEPIEAKTAEAAATADAAPAMAASAATTLDTTVVEPVAAPAASRPDLPTASPTASEERPVSDAPAFVAAPAAAPEPPPVQAPLAEPVWQPAAAVVPPVPVETPSAPPEKLVAVDAAPRRAADDIPPRALPSEPVAPAPAAPMAPAMAAPIASPPPPTARASEAAATPAPARESRDSTSLERLRGIAAAKPKLPPTITRSRWSRRSAALAGAAVALLAVSVLGARAAARLEERREHERADLAQATAAAARPTTPASPATATPTPSTAAPSAPIAQPSLPAAAPATTGSAAGHRVSPSAAANVPVMPAGTPAAPEAPASPERASTAAAAAAARTAEPRPAAPVSVSLASLPVVTLSAASLAALQDTVKAARPAVAAPSTPATSTTAVSAAAAPSGSTPPATGTSSAVDAAPAAAGSGGALKAPAPRKPAAPDAGALALASAERLLGARDYRQARTQADAAISASPRVPGAYAVRARVRLLQGEIREAWADAEMAARLGDFWSAQAATTIVEHRAGDTTSARQRVDGLLRLTDGGKRPLAARDEIQFAMALAAVGDRTRAFAALQRVDPGEPSLVAALQDPVFDALRTDSRFQAIAERARRASAGGAARRRS
jgi:hypothetical protein